MIVSFSAEYADLQVAILAFMQEGKGDFDKLAVAVFQFQFRFNSAYQTFCRLRGIDEKIKHWHEIPAVPQQAFKASCLTTFPQSESIREFRTSGTTGEGYGSHYFYDLSLYDAAISCGIKRLQLGKCRHFVLTPSSREAPFSSLSYMMERLLGGDETRFYFSKGILQEKRFRHDLQEMDQPVILLATALALIHLMEKSKEKIVLPMGSRIFETGGYKGATRVIPKEKFYADLSDFFNVETDLMINEYGMTELSSQYYTSGLGNVHQAGPWLRHRVVHPITREEVADGEVGVLQLFDLANLGSVLAIETEDLAVRKGADFLLLGRDPAAVMRGCSRSIDEILSR